MPRHHCNTSFTGNGADPGVNAAVASSETTRRFGMSDQAPVNVRPILLEFEESEHFFLLFLYLPTINCSKPKLAQKQIRYSMHECTRNRIVGNVRLGRVKQDFTRWDRTSARYISHRNGEVI